MCFSWKVLAVVCLCLGFALGSPVDEFSKFKAAHGKTYNAIEEQER